MVERNQKGVVHEPCPKCGSKDNLARYPDGHGYCFGECCNHYEHGSDSSSIQDISKSNGVFRQGIYESLNKRGISEETCRFFKYQVSYDNNKKVHIAPYFNEENKLIAQQLRTKEKDFPVLGETRDLGLWGKQCWTSGKRIVITEGEIDTLSVAEVQRCQYPVVSIPNGVGSACKAIAKDLEWLLGSFEEIVLIL